MRKLLATFVGLISLLLITLAVSYAALNTKYATQVVNMVFKYILQQPIEVESVYYSYQDPKYIQLEGVIVQPNDTSIPINHMEVWLGDNLLENNQLQIDNILIDGMSLQHSLPKLSISPYIHLNQLTMGNVNWINQDWSLWGIKLQIKSPQFTSSQSIPFYGRAKFSADRLSWQQQTLSHIIINGNVTKDKSTFYDIKFHWQQGNFKAQATKNKDQKQWAVPRASIANLRLQKADLNNLKPETIDWLTSIPVEINQLDVIDSSFETTGFSFNNVTINATNLELPFTLWQQHNATIFATANTMSAFDHAIYSPAVNINLQPNLLNIKDTSLDLLEGNLHLQGKMTPTSLELNQFHLNNIKWFPKPQSKQRLISYFSQLKDIKAQTVSINNIQVIDLSEPAKQASGLSIDGKDLNIKQDGKWGLWNGQLSASANNASYDGVNSKNLFTDMHTKSGHFWLDELFVPLDNGLIKGTSDINFKQLSQPWNLNLDASGIPLRFFSRWLDLPFHLDGITDFTLKGEGLYGDQVIFNHSVTGKLNASVTNASSDDDFQAVWLRNQGVSLEPLIDPNAQKGSEITKTSSVVNSATAAAKNPATISDIHLVADRGRISLQPFDIKAKDFSAHFGGKYDFLHPEDGNLQYRLEGSCQALTFNMLGDRGSILVEDDCN